MKYPHHKLDKGTKIVAFRIGMRTVREGEIFVDATYGEHVVQQAKMMMNQATVDFYVCNNMELLQGRDILVETRYLKRKIERPPRRVMAYDSSARAYRVINLME